MSSYMLYYQTAVLHYADLCVGYSFLINIILGFIWVAQPLPTNPLAPSQLPGFQWVSSALHQLFSWHVQGVSGGISGQEEG